MSLLFNNVFNVLIWIILIDHWLLFLSVIFFLLWYNIKYKTNEIQNTLLILLYGNISNVFCYPHFFPFRCAMSNSFKALFNFEDINKVCLFSFWRYFHFSVIHKFNLTNFFQKNFTFKVIGKIFWIEFCRIKLNDLAI